MDPEQASAVFPFFTRRICYTIVYGGLSVWVTIVAFYVWEVRLLKKVSLKWEIKCTIDSIRRILMETC